jgi:hypothetical protein
MKEISYLEYSELLKEVRANNKLAYLNCCFIADIEGSTYLKSDQGISYLRPDGFMGGLCRIKEGFESVSVFHQRFRIQLGGFFTECYDTALVDLYSKQGFKVIARVDFNPEFAEKGWEKDKSLILKPDVVFLSLFNRPVIQGASYVNAYDYALKSLVNNYECIS